MRVTLPVGNQGKTPARMAPSRTALLEAILPPPAIPPAAMSISVEYENPAVVKVLEDQPHPGHPRPDAGPCPRTLTAPVSCLEWKADSV